jgi:aldose sugar dehydrogenase
MHKIGYFQVSHLLFIIIGSATASIFAIMSFGLFNNGMFVNKQVDVPLLQGDYNNGRLKIELVSGGFFSPTSMAFLDDHKILVLEKNTGAVRIISDGKLQDKPVLKLHVDPRAERGLLGIAILHTKDYNNNNNNNNNNNGTNNTKVFLYFTEPVKKSSNNRIGNENLRNRVYKYDWNGQTLVNPRLVLDLPAFPGPYHNGGKLTIGPSDHYLYLVIGDLTAPNTQALNNKNGLPANGVGGILRVTQYGKIVPNPPLGNNYPLNLYYAYGIRNSFGISFDPVTNTLWDTENGEDRYDEINVVKPGFNSGWYKIMGPISRNNIINNINDTLNNANLVNFPGSHYSDPVLSWYHSIGVTDIEFFKSSKLGEKYKSNLFVGDINNGNLYYFEVNHNGTGLEFPDSLGLKKDNVVDNNKEVSELIFASGFRGITDIKTGPDGYLYILSYLDGKLYRIVPR